MNRLLGLVLLATVAGCTQAELRSFEPENLLAVTRPGDYLKPKPYAKLVIEVMAAQGTPSNIAAVAMVQNEAINYCGKPGGVTVQTDPPIAGITPRQWSDYQLQDLVTKYAKLNSGGDTAVLHILFVPGVYTTSNMVAGITFAADAFAVFPDVYASATWAVETILMHEFGHVMGLVNNGTPMARSHEDSSHPGHCILPSCLMWWQSSNQMSFCPDCVRDLQAARGN